MGHAALLAGALASILVSLPAAAGIPIRGRVLGPGGAPLEDATAVLVLRRSDYERSREFLAGRHDLPATVRTRSDRRGFYALEAPEAGLWRIEVSAAGHVAQRHNFTPLYEAVNLPTVTLPAGSDVIVRVTDTGGRPLAGAVVVALKDRPRRAQPGWISAPSVGRTGEDGRVEITASEGERTRIRALAPGHLESAVAEIDVGHVPKKPIPLKLEPGLPLLIEVRDGSGRPQPEAMVHVGEWGLPAGLTNAEGRFEIAVPRQDDVLVEIATADLRGRDERLALGGDTSGKPGDDEDTPRILVLPDLLEIHGRVVDKTTRDGVAQALVWLRNYRGLLTRTDPAGSYTLRFVPRGWYASVEVARPGYFRETAKVLRGELPDGPTLALVPAAALEGTVVDDGGEPVAGALVRARESQPLVDPRSRQPPSREALGASSAEGRFRLARVRPHTPYEIEAESPGFAPSGRTVMAPEPGDTVALDPIVLSRGQLGVGFVLDADSRPIAGAAAVLLRAVPPPRYPPGVSSAAPPPPPQVVGSATSDSEGRLELPNLAPGRFEIHLSAAGFAPLDIPKVDIPEGTGETDLGTRRLQPGTVIAGRVFTADHQPIGGAEVRIRPRDRMGKRPFDLKAPAVTRTAADGFFAIRDLPGGRTFDLYVDGDGWTGTLVPAVTAPEDGVEVTLPPSASLAGRVTDESDQPISGAWIWARPPFDRERSVLRVWPRRRSDAEGRFEFTDLVPGRIRLMVTAEGRRDFQRQVDLAPAQSLSDYKIVLAEGAVLVGQVLDADGEPVLGARVASTARSGESFTPVYTDGEGRYRIEGLATGPREVRASTPDGKRTSGRVTIEPGRNVFDLAFERTGVTVSGQVVGPDGEPLAGITLQLVAQREIRSVGLGTMGSSYSWGPASHTTSGADGAFVFEQVTDGRYQLQVDHPGYTSRNPDEVFEVRGTAAAGLLVHLASGAVIHGEIHGLRAEDLAGLHVTAMAVPDRTASSKTVLSYRHYQATVHHDGTYRIADLGPGTWSVNAFLMAQNRRADGTVNLAEGQTEAVLDLEFASGLVLTGQVVARSEPRPGVRVRATRLPSPGDTARGVHLPSSSSTTDHAGRFRFEGLEPGRYQLLVASFALLQPLEEIDLVDDAEVVLELPAGRLSGRVRDPSGEGLAAAGIRIERLDEGAPVFTGNRPPPRTDGEGAFVLDGLQEGRYRVTARKDGYGPAWHDVELVSGGEFRGPDLVLQPTQGLELEVVDAAGGPLPHVLVTIVDASGRGVLGDVYSIDADGRARIPNAPLGSWELLVKGPGVATRVRAEIPAAGPLRVVLPVSGILQLSAPVEILTAPEGATLTLNDAAGRPYQEPAYGGLVRDSWPLYGRPSVDLELPAGVWTVRVTAGERGSEAVVEVVAGAATQLVLE